MNQEIPVFFTIDDTYAPMLAVALHSAVANADPTRRYRAIVLHQNLAESHRQRLKALETENFQVSFHSMESGLEAITDRRGNRLRCDYFTLTIYFRLFIPALFSQYDKGIYVDSDVVFNEDIAKLYDTELGEALIGGCADLSISGVPEFVAYTEEVVGADKGGYINSGVLLMNMKGLREAGYQERFLSLLDTYHFDSVAPDQDYINAMCKGHIRYLPAAWDAMPGPGEPLAHPCLVHYNLFSKPWCYDGVQYEALFWRYAETSGYYEELRSLKDGFTEEQKREEARCLANMLARAVELMDAPCTLRKVAESGVAVRL